MSVNDKMTAIADKIRTLVGATGTMGLDAMATNVGTANTAVASAITALTDKGVTVPDGTNVTGLAELISAIEAGGGSGSVASGSITPTEDNSNLNIEHNLGVAPKAFVIYSSATMGIASTTTKELMLYFAIYTGDAMVQPILVMCNGNVSYGSVPSLFRVNNIASILISQSSEGEITGGKNFSTYGSDNYVANKTHLRVTVSSSISKNYSIVVGKSYNWMVFG